MSLDPAAFDETLANARRRLLDARNAAGHWEGGLSSSALSTATAVFALHQFWSAAPPDNSSRDRDQACARLVREGLAWLAMNQNADGGWGDTTLSFSNISTTALCWAAFAVEKSAAAGYASTVAAAEAWLAGAAGGLEPRKLAKAVADRYGEDRTFSVPILTMLAIAGRLGPPGPAWRLVPQLPFELAAFPQRWYKWLRLPVVSYALPALVAIGQARHHNRPTLNPVARAARAAARPRTLRLLDRIQPSGGGFLEATPLTSFVLMSLVAAGAADHPVAPRAVDFLIRSARPDGSWPIDTNLATWVTTLAVNALASNPDFHRVMPAEDRRKVRDWLLGQQYRTEHPYTLADPGGWAWTDLPGGVPDADDTPGALLALKNLGDVDDRVKEAAAAAVTWLLDLQNRDGGMPTFCRGWGKLPFDRSSADLTAHAVRAWFVWQYDLPQPLGDRVGGAIRRAVHYLYRSRRDDGAWVPLWFGCQHVPGEQNPTYGTSRVASAASLGDLLTGADPIRSAPGGRGLQWLASNQGADGGWGGAAGAPPSIEETALATAALCDGACDVPERRAAVERGVSWLIERTDRGRRFDPSPIGFYFAKLWYYEKLYPLIFTVGALERARVDLGLQSGRP